MWFSPLKGAHLTLGQLDKTLPVNMSTAANKNIERGSFVYIYTNSGTEDPQFALYTDTVAKVANAVPYIALMSVYDFQAGMAGNVGQAPAVDPSIAEAPDGVGSALSGGAATFVDVQYTEGRQAVNGPRITAISCVQPAEYQTTAFDKSKTYYVGQPLTIDNNGKLTPFTDNHNIVGYVTAKPKVRWINDLGSSVNGARISGGNAKVLEFSTAWIPVAATATGDDKTVQTLNTGKPQVASAAGAAPAAAKPAVNAAPAK